MYPSSDEGLNKATDHAVYFFTPSFHPLDNFSAHSLTLWDYEFPTAEHAYQWKKFSETLPAIAAQIRTTTSPHLAKEISDAHKLSVPPGWHDRKVAIMEEILAAKAQQHADVRDALKRTGNRTIIENSQVDHFWGIGQDHKGENVIGKIWMRIRDTL